MSLPRPAAGGESCKQDSFLYTVPSRGNSPLRGAGVAGVARHVGKKVVSLLDYTAPYRGDILL